MDGNTDLAAIGRSLTEQEKAQGLVSVAVSRHKIAIVVGSENPFKGDLTFEQFAKIFRGEIKDWAQLGGEPGPIRFIDRPDNSDTRQAFRNYPVFKKAPFTTGKTAKQLAQDSTSQVVQALRTDGIGYAIADQLQGRGDVRVLTMNQTLPNNAKYPFSQPLVYVYKGPQPNPSAQAFLGFATAPASRKTIETARKEASAALATNADTVSSPKVTVPSPPVASPLATSAPQANAPSSGSSTSLPWWLWLLGLPLLGGLLWWLLHNRESQPEDIMPLPKDTQVPPVGAIAPDTQAMATEQPPLPLNAAARIGGAPLAGSAVLAGDRSGFPRDPYDSRIILVPRDSSNADAYWEVPSDAKESQREQGGQKLTLRLYDVTEGLNPEQILGFQQFDVDEQTSEQPLSVPTANRDYVVELGYVTSNDRWLKLARSSAVRVPSATATAVATELSSQTTARQDAFQAGSAFPSVGHGGAGLGAAGLGGGAALSASAGEGAQAVARDRTIENQPTSQSQIFLVPRNAHSAYVHWDVNQADKDALKHQGGQQLVLRVYEVADMNSTAAYNVQQFLCHEWDQDQHVPIPVSNLDYVAELGYTTLDGRFLRLAQSPQTRVPGS